MPLLFNAASQDTAVEIEEAVSYAEASHTMPAVSDSAVATAAVSSTVPVTIDQIAELYDSSVVMAPTPSTLPESAPSMVSAASEAQGHQILAHEQEWSTNSIVPPLSLPRSSAESTKNAIEMFSSRGHGDEEESQNDEGVTKDDSATNATGMSRESKTGMEPVIFSSVGHDDVGVVADDGKSEGTGERKGDGGELKTDHRREGNDANEIAENESAQEDGEQEEKGREYPVDSTESWKSDSSSKEGQRQGQPYGVEEGTGRLPICSSGTLSAVNEGQVCAIDGDGGEQDREKVPDAPVDAIDGGEDRAERQLGDADEATEKEEGYSTPPNDKILAAGAPVNSSPAMPDVAPSKLDERMGEVQQKWQWWDTENPWSRGLSTSMSTDINPSASTPPPPAYQEVASPPPYQEIIADLYTPRSSAQRRGGDRRPDHLSSEPATKNQRASPAPSKDASDSLGDDTSRSPPPSYRSVVSAAAGQGAKSHSSSSYGDGAEEEKCPVAALPPPSHGRFYNDFPSTMALSSLPRETNSSISKPKAAEWLTQGEHQQQFRTVPDTGRGGGRAGGRYRITHGPETTEGGQLEVGEWEEAHRRQRRHGGGRRRSSTATGGGARPKSTTSLPRGEDTKKGATLSGTESWDDDRWRLTRYLGACKKELAEADERRRRAEAAANAAERSAWAARNSKGGDDETAKRAWAKAATQRVLDLMLVTERVRQEEQKRRVAAARASNQVARCKQPFRERRGRSQKGPFIGPSVPPVDIPEAPRTQRRSEAAAALKVFYWDEHGRRYRRRGSALDGIGDREGMSVEVGIAMEVVRDVAANCLAEGVDFGQPFREIDSDGDGKLTLAELGAALRRAGARLSLSQVTAIFRHFDGGLGLDTVGRGEFLWEFVDLERLLKQWKKAGDVRGGRQARLAPFRNRARRASFTCGGGGSGGSGCTLSRHDVLDALEELQIHVDGWEADALLDRFTVEDDGNNVDWLSFVSFMQAVENRDDEKNINRSTSRRQRARLSATLPRQSRQQQQTQQRKRHWATSGLPGRGGGLFEGEGPGNGSTRSRPTSPAMDTATKRGDKPYQHWASSVVASTRGRSNNYEGGSGINLSRTATSAAVAAHRGRSMWEAPPYRARGIVGISEEGAGGGGGDRPATIVTASRMLDELLEGQQELEAFLEEEFAKRELQGAESGKVGVHRRQEVD